MPMGDGALTIVVTDHSGWARSISLLPARSLVNGERRGGLVLSNPIDGGTTLRVGWRHNGCAGTRTIELRQVGDRLNLTLGPRPRLGDCTNEQGIPIVVQLDFDRPVLTSQVDPTDLTTPSH